MQKNGQIGLFPEHSAYDDFLISSINQVKSASNTDYTPKVLNLFAYTGWSTLVCLINGAHVTHVDISKQVLSWAFENFKLNNIPEKNLRIICEDALLFLEKEIKRDKKYDIIIADPPSFSRVTDKKSWDLGDIVTKLIADMYKVLGKDEEITKNMAGPTGKIVYASHYFDIGPEDIRNLMLDEIRDGNVDIMYMQAEEYGSGRRKMEGFAVLGG